MYPHGIIKKCYVVLNVLFGWASFLHRPSRTVHMLVTYKESVFSLTDDHAWASCLSLKDAAEVSMSTHRLRCDGDGYGKQRYWVSCIFCHTFLLVPNMALRDGECGNTFQFQTIQKPSNLADSYKSYESDLGSERICTSYFVSKIWQP